VRVCRREEQRRMLPVKGMPSERGAFSLKPTITLFPLRVQEGPGRGDCGPASSRGFSAEPTRKRTGTEAGAPEDQQAGVRLKGELLLIQNASDSAEAEQAFRTAIDVARRQQARFYELLATNRLAGLLNKQAKRDEARAMLAEIYGWFTEGLNSADLKDAKALLEELNK
jgi:hypothetical protein